MPCNRLVATGEHRSAARSSCCCAAPPAVPACRCPEPPLPAAFRLVAPTPAQARPCRRIPGHERGAVRDGQAAVTAAGEMLEVASAAAGWGLVRGDRLRVQPVPWWQTKPLKAGALLLPAHMHMLVFPTKPIARVVAAGRPVCGGRPGPSHLRLARRAGGQHDASADERLQRHAGP